MLKGLNVKIDIRPRDIYPGKRIRRSPGRTAVIILATLIFSALMMFYSMQKYIVYSKDGISLELPILASEMSVPAEISDGSEVLEFAPVDAEIVISAPDFMSIPSNAGANLPMVSAIFVKQADVTALGIQNLLRRMEALSADAVVLEMKPESGQLTWMSGLEVPHAYGTNGTENMDGIMTALKNADVYTIAYVSVCIDRLMSERGSPWALRNTDDKPFTDEFGRYWLDPYNHALRNQVAAMMRELQALGFDEILLANIAHPPSSATQGSAQNSEDGLVIGAGNGIVYSQQVNLGIAPTVSNFTLGLTQQFSDSELHVSAVLDTSALRNGTNEQIGQDPNVFFRFFDRVAVFTNTADSDRSNAAAYIHSGSVDTRFLPITETTSENGSRVLVLSP